MKKKSFADILCDISDTGAAKMRRKVPQWADSEGLSFPTQLCTEQCSSSATALYKAGLLSRLDPQDKPEMASSCGHLPAGYGGFAPTLRVVDLTGGLGVDCWAFSRIASHVHHNEMDRTLSEAVQANFKALGVTGVTFSSVEVRPGGSVTRVLEASGGGADVIYLDPARRSGTGRKVFLLEDCSPDILSLKDELLAAAPRILVKLSPMADVTMVCRRLGTEVKEVHVVGAEGECKELLVLLERGWSGGYSVTVRPDCGEGASITFSPEEEAAAAPALHPGPDSLKSAKMLFEPSPALLKAGCFSLLCSRLPLVKLGRFTHLYTLPEEEEAVMPYGKLFKIKDILPFNGANVKALGKSLSKCDVTSRNLPVKSEDLRKKMGVTPGGDTHVFAFQADFGGSPSEKLLLVCERVIRP